MRAICTRVAKKQRREQPIIGVEPTTCAPTNGAKGAANTSSRVYVANETAVAPENERSLLDFAVHDSRHFSPASTNHMKGSGVFGSVGRVTWTGSNVNNAGFLAKALDSSDSKSGEEALLSSNGMNSSTNSSSTNSSSTNSSSESDCDSSGKVSNVKKRKHYVLKQTPSVESFQRVWRSTAERRKEEARALLECETMRKLCASACKHANICYAEQVWIEPMPILSSGRSTSSFERGCLLFERKPSDLFTYIARVAKRNEKRWQPFPLIGVGNNDINGDDNNATVVADYRTHRRFARLGVPLETAGHIVAQVAAAAAFLHTRFGLVHNDIKPENVLFDAASQHCWLTDFGGTSAPCAHRDAYDARTATKHFASPERRMRLPFGYESDSWSLGMLAIECVYGSVMVDRWYDQPTWNSVISSAAASSSSLMREPISADILNTLCPFSSAIVTDNDVRENEYRNLIENTLKLLPCNRLLAKDLLTQYTLLLAIK